MRYFVVCLGLILPAWIFAFHPQATLDADDHEATAVTSLASRSPSELIDLLANPPSDGIDKFDADFLQSNASVDLTLGIERTAKEKESESNSECYAVIVQEIIRRGVDALPELIAHLEDARETKLLIRAGKFHGLDAQLCGSGRPVVFGDRFDFRRATGASTPGGVNTGEERRIDGTYTIRVGDLCYVAIGKIVNREYIAVEILPNGGLINADEFDPEYIVTSPVFTTSIADAVRHDWGNLTKEDHIRSLVADAYVANLHAWYPAERSSGAIERLVLYYPQVAERVVLDLLSRPIYYDHVVRSFIDEELMTTGDSSTWRTRLERFRREKGSEIAATIPAWLDEIYVDTKDSPPVSDDQRTRAQDILRQMFPKFYLRPSGQHGALTGHAAMIAIHSARHLKSDRVDAAADRIKGKNSHER